MPERTRHQIRRTRALVIPALAIALITGIAPGRATHTEPVSPFVPSQVVVRFKNAATPAMRRAALASVRGTVVMHLSRIDFDVVRIPATMPVLDAVRVLRASAAISNADPDHVGMVAGSGPDPCIAGCAAGRQWAVGAMNAHAGWARFPARFYDAASKRDLNAVKVAVLDTKIDTSLSDWVNPSDVPLNHPADANDGGQLDLSDAGDFISSSDYQGNYEYHGSFVAGIVGAATHNADRVAGFAYAAQVMPVTVVRGDGRPVGSAVAAGITWAVDHGARVINASFVFNADDPIVRTAVTDAARADVLVVAAAGNAGTGAAAYPAWYPEAMSVGAVQEDDRPAACSNHSFKTSVAAPGTSIVSLDPFGASGLRSEVCSTSSATAHVSALAALLFAQKPSRNATEVRAIIEEGADDARTEIVKFSGADEWYGTGRINFERALALIDPDLAQVVQLTATFPRAQGGQSRAAAIAYVTAPNGVASAEWFLDSVGGPGTGGTVLADDGAFDSDAEAVVADIDAPLSTSTGVHRLFVRAKDANGVWGPCAVAAFIVDRTPPAVSGLTVTNAPNQGALGTTLIHFRINDDYASTGSYYFKVTRTVASIQQELYRSDTSTNDIPFETDITYEPAMDVVGPVTITVVAKDASNNSSSSSINAVIL